LSEHETAARPRVLIVDDDGVSRRIFAHLLRDEALDLTFAENGARGLALIRAGSFDVVFSDLHMPILGGHDMLKLARPFSKARFVALSSDEEAARLFDAWIPKPFTREQILSEIAEALRAKATRA
jgi:CheY-like chemotaxis protein